MSLDANRKLQIDYAVKNAALEKAQFNQDQVRNGGKYDPKTFSVSIFPTDLKLSDEEKDYAYKKFAQEVLLTFYDKNNDKTVSVEEFAARETADSNPNNEKGKVAAAAERTGNLLGNNLDVNGDGEISIDEFTYFLKETDKADDVNGKEMDGKFTSPSEQLMYKSVVGIEKQVKNAEYKKINEKYLSGENLTPEEQKILDKCSQEIRENMAKQAKETFNMDLGAVGKKEKTIYLGDVPQEESTQTSQTEQTNKTSMFGDFNKQMQQLQKMMMLMMAPMMKMFGGVQQPQEPTKQEILAQKRQQMWGSLGNLFGSGLNFGLMMGMMNSTDNCYGGLGWYFK